jgi:hypothetical protein
MEPNIINIFLGSFFAGIVLILVVQRLPGMTRRLRITTRNAYRRMVGMVSFETLMLDELRTYRSDVDNWTRPVRSETRLLKQEIVGVRRDVATRMAADRTRNNRVRTEVEEMGVLLRSYTDLLGPIWNTAQGHRMPMRLLSTGHLDNIVEGGFGGYEAREFARNELDRRRIDAKFREDAANGIPAPTLEQMAAERQSAAMGRARRAISPLQHQLALAPGDQNRVNQFSPQWARKLITELRTGTVTRLDMVTTKRLRILPVWTRTIVNDLLLRSNR